MFHLETIKKKSYRFKELLFLIPLLSILVIGKIFFELSIINFALFLLYIALYIYFPGKIIYKVLKIENSNNMIESVMAFFLGVFFIIIQYYAFSLINSLYLIKYFIPILLILRVFYLKKQNKPIFLKKSNKRLEGSTYLFMGINTFISAVFTLFAFPIPTVVSNASTYQDVAWHMGNVNILSSGSNLDSRVYGVKFLYHYFSDLFYAISKYIFGFSAYELIIQFQFIVIGTVLTLSVIGFFKTMFKNNNFLIYFSSFVFFYAPTTLNGYYNNVFYHTFTNVNAMAFTFPLIIIILLIIKNTLEVKRNNQNILLISIFMFLLAGFKGPIALMILVALVVLTFAMLIQKTNDIFWFKFLLVATFSYAIIHFTLLSQGSDLVTIGLDSAFDVITSTSLFPGGLNNPSSNFFMRFTYVIPHFIIVVFFFSVPYLWSLVNNVYGYLNKKMIPLFDQFSLIFSVLSLGAYYIIRHSGYSQMYFLFGTLPVIYYLGGKELEKVLVKKSKKDFKIVFLITLSLLLIRPIFGTVDVVKEKINQNYSTFKNKPSDYFNSSISSLEYEGMMWIKDNTTINDLLGTNRHNGDKKFFLYSAYSERRFYIEGPEYAKNSGLKPDKAQYMLEQNDLLFSLDYPHKHTLAKKLGLNYLVQYKKQQPSDLFNKENGFVQCFENEDISIYKVLE